MFTDSVGVVVEPAETVHVYDTPPFEPTAVSLHCPTVASATEVTPGVFVGVQVPTAGGLANAPMNELTHW